MTTLRTLFIQEVPLQVSGTSTSTTVIPYPIGTWTLSAQTTLSMTEFGSAGGGDNQTDESAEAYISMYRVGTTNPQIVNSYSPILDDSSDVVWVMFTLNVGAGFQVDDAVEAESVCTVFLES
jgi:hypothetical protein